MSRRSLVSDLRAVMAGYQSACVVGRAESGATEKHAPLKVVVQKLSTHQLSLPMVIAEASPVASSSSSSGASMPARCGRVAVSTPTPSSTATAATQNGRCTLTCSPRTPARSVARLGLQPDYWSDSAAGATLFTHSRRAVRFYSHCAGMLSPNTPLLGKEALVRDCPLCGDGFAVGFVLLTLGGHCVRKAVRSE
jgi:hypothetical protein